MPRAKKITIPVTKTPPTRTSKVPPNETPHDRFVRLANHRSRIVVRYIRALGRLGADSYDRRPEDIDKLQKVLFTELNDAMTLLRHGTVAASIEDIL